MGDIKPGICALLILAMNLLVTDNCTWQLQRYLWHYKAIVTKDVITQTRLNTLILWTLQQAQCHEACFAIQVRHFIRKIYRGLSLTMAQWCFLQEGFLDNACTTCWTTIINVLQKIKLTLCTNDGMRAVKLQLQSFRIPVLGGIYLSSSWPSRYNPGKIASLTHRMKGLLGPTPSHVALEGMKITYLEPRSLGCLYRGLVTVLIYNKILSSLTRPDILHKFVNYIKLAKRNTGAPNPWKSHLTEKHSLAIRRMFGFNPVNTGMCQSHQLFPIRLF